METYPPRDRLIAYYEEQYSIYQEVLAKAQQASTLLVKPGRAFDRILEAGGGGRLLDIGCGSGDLVKSLLPRFNSVAGTDVSGVALAKARKAVPAGLFRQVDSMVLPFGDRSFDLVVSNQVLEHIYPDETDLFFSEISRVMANDGRVVVATPNGDEIRRRLLWFPIRVFAYLTRKPEMLIASRLYWIQNHLLSGGTAKAKLFARYGFLEHINIVGAKQIRTSAARAGLRVEHVEYDGFRPLFPKVLQLFGLIDCCDRIEDRLHGGRRWFMSNQTWVFVKESVSANAVQHRSTSSMGELIQPLTASSATAKC
jgi:SAM-dependent methyltransferase